MTDGQTESDAYEPTVQYAQVGLKIGIITDLGPLKYKSVKIVLIGVRFLLLYVRDIGVRDVVQSFGEIRYL